MDTITHIYYMTSDNVFSDWLTSLVTIFDQSRDVRRAEYNIYSPRVT